MKSLALLFPAYLLYLHGKLKSTVSDIPGPLEQIIASVLTFKLTFTMFVLKFTVDPDSDYKTVCKSRRSTYEFTRGILSKLCIKQLWEDK